MDSLISHQAQKGVHHGVGPRVWFVCSHYYFFHKSAQNTSAGLLLSYIKKVEFESHPEASPAGQSVACSHIFSSIHTWNRDWVQSTKNVPPPSNGKCWAQPSSYSWKSPTCVEAMPPRCDMPETVLSASTGAKITLSPLQTLSPCCFCSLFPCFLAVHLLKCKSINKEKETQNFSPFVYSYLIVM